MENKVARRRDINERFWKKVDIKNLDKCWEWKAGLFPNNYGKFYVDGKTLYAHRVAWELTNEYIPKGKLVLHRCDNKKCVNPGHLYLGTYSDNSRDKWTRNPIPLEAISHAKLHEGEIWLIRKLLKEGKRIVNQTEIGKMFGVAQTTISLIKRSEKVLSKEKTYV